VVAQEPGYKPNEAALKVSTLKAQLGSLQAANTAVRATYTAWNNHRIMRDNIFHNGLTGMVQTALQAKKYVKSIFGTTSAQFKQVNGLEFRNKRI
jgi:hypothetical protein